MMTLDAARASWTEVLGEFARKAGVRFHYTVAPLGMVTGRVLESPQLDMDGAVRKASPNRHLLYHPIAASNANATEGLS